MYDIVKKIDENNGIKVQMWVQDLKHIKWLNGNGNLNCFSFLELMSANTIAPPPPLVLLLVLPLFLILIIIFHHVLPLKLKHYSN